MNDDELLPDLHITRAGAAGIGAHQEHVVDQDARAADRSLLLLSIATSPFDERSNRSKKKRDSVPAAMYEISVACRKMCQECWKICQKECLPISLATALDAAMKNCWTTLMFTAR